MGSQASPANLVPLRNNRLNIVSNLIVCKAIVLIFINSNLADCIWPIGVSISNCWLRILSWLVSISTADQIHLQPGSDWKNIWFQNLVFTATITLYKFTYYWICTCFPRLDT